MAGRILNLSLKNFPCNEIILLWFWIEITIFWGWQSLLFSFLLMQLCFEGTLFLRSYGNQSSNQLSKHIEKLVLDSFEMFLYFLLLTQVTFIPFLNHKFLRNKKKKNLRRCKQEALVTWRWRLKHFLQFLNNWWFKK